MEKNDKIVITSAGIDNEFLYTELKISFGVENILSVFKIIEVLKSGIYIKVLNKKYPAVYLQDNWFSDDCFMKVPSYPKKRTELIY